MSNGVPYDPLIVHYLARELDERLRGRACAAAPMFGADHEVTLPLEGGETLRLDLHPARGWIRILADPASSSAPLEARCAGVEAAADERLIRIRLDGGDRFRASERSLLVELHTNQWNALVVSGDERILALLRTRRAGSRVLAAGEPYAPPGGAARFGAEPVTEGEARDRWQGEMTPLAAGSRRAALLAGWSYTGLVSASWILGDEEEIEGAFRRWWWLRSLPAAAPVLLNTPRGPVPYPLPLRGIAGEPVPSLLAAMEVLAAAEGSVQAPAERPLPVERVAARLRAAERRVGRLQAELEEAAGAAELRAFGDLLLAHLHLVPRGAAEVLLPGWEGDDVRIELDPTLSPADNAARWYDRARRRARAAERIPALLEDAERELQRWAAAAEMLSRGLVPDWLEQELRAAAEQHPSGARPSDEPSLPYRRYRTSGGLEVRVGRSSRGNDQLTFHHAAPNDVWLHARSVPGSHVILRWPDAEASPPARDLAEAAALAALFSKARTSSLVAVDWTRRKHVRKPRGSAAGLVIPQRVRTVFVEPDSALEERMRVE